MRYVNAKLTNQYKLKYQLNFSVILKTYGEEKEILAEIESQNTLKTTENLTQSEIENINIQWRLQNRMQSIEMKKSGWIF